jgi:flavin-dependent dehydrogenase
MYDVIIVGARCAGSATARLLAGGGLDVLVVDRAAFPSDTLSTHWLHEPAVAFLRDWGLLDAVFASGAPPINLMSLDVGPFVLQGSPAGTGEVPALAPRRTVLDSILVEAARDAGAEIRESFSVHELVHSGDGRVTGIRGGPGSGTVETAGLVVGADGLHSLVARTMAGEAYNERPSLTCTYYAYWSGLPTKGVEIFLGDRVAWGAIPTNDDLTTVVLSWQHRRFQEFRRDVTGNYLATLRSHPEFADRLAAARMESRIVGTADLPNLYRRPFGPGWALAGDAGHHQDPCTAQGITDAFRDSQLLAEAILKGFDQGADLDGELAKYEAARNQATRPLFDFTCMMAEMEPPGADTMRMFARLRDDQAATERFLGVIAGTVSPPEFFGSMTS